MVFDKVQIRNEKLLQFWYNYEFGCCCGGGSGGGGGIVDECLGLGGSYHLCENMK